MRITGLYAALCAILVVGLALRVVMHRFRHRIGIGDGGDKSLVQLIRVHGNAIENVPLALLLLLLLELNQTAPLWLHVFGIVLVLGRIVHAFGLSRSTGGLGLVGGRQLDIEDLALAHPGDAVHAKRFEGAFDGLALWVENAVLEGHGDTRFHGGLGLFGMCPTP